MESPRGSIITPSQYEWERRGLDFIRKGLPDHDPYRAWANFEFQTNDGAIYEVDLLVLTYPRGMAAERALRLGIGALSGLGVGDGEPRNTRMTRKEVGEITGGLTVQQIRDRIQCRYPLAEPLPDHPALQDLLIKVGF